MPLTRFIVDALGVVTISLIAILLLLGLFCILYSIYFRRRIHSQRFIQLGYFCGPWIIRIAFILIAFWWSVGEIIRLNLLRHNGRLLNAVSLTWKENVCRCYIVSNLGFAEPCFLLILVFLLRASLQKLGPLSHHWNCKTAGYVLLYCLPMFILQMMVILFGPRFHKVKNLQKLPPYFTKIAFASEDNDVSYCAYPLLSVIVHGVFTIILTCYLFWLGRRILHSVINKGLQKRIYILIASVSCLFPLRVVLLGLSNFSEPEYILFQTLVFLAFLSLLICAGVGICILVYLPVADSLALESLQKDVEGRRRFTDEHNETISLIANQGPLGESSVVSTPGRDSEAKRGSISFRTMERGETSGASPDIGETLGGFVELSLFDPSQHSTPPGSPHGWPMRSPPQVHVRQEANARKKSW